MRPSEDNKTGGRERTLRDSIERRSRRRDGEPDLERGRSLRERLKRLKRHEQTMIWPGGEMAMKLRLLTLAERRTALDAARATVRERGLADDQNALRVEETSAVLASPCASPTAGQCSPRPQSWPSW